MKKLLRLGFLPYQKKKLLFESLFFVWLIRLSLWCLPFKLLNKLLSYFDDAGFDHKETDWMVVTNVVRSVRSCSRYVPNATCLAQALAARTLLQLRGQNPQLKIGVEKDEDREFKAHAWIEVDGRIVIGKVPYHQRFTVLKSSGSVIL